MEVDGGASGERQSGINSGKADGSSTQDTPGKKMKRDKDAASKKAALAMAPQMQMWAKKSAELHGGAQGSQAGGSTPDFAISGLGTSSHPERAPRGLGGADSSNGSASNEPYAPHANDQYESYADWTRLECPSCNVKFKSEEWLRCHEIRTHHLYKDGTPELLARSRDMLGARGLVPRTIILRVPTPKGGPLPDYTSYADLDKLVCYLCNARLGNLDILRLHERESRKHLDLLAKPDRVQEATAALSNAGLKPMPMSFRGYNGAIRAGDKIAGQYRDRAQERREVFNQPNHPVPEKRKTGKVANEEADDQQAKKATSKGADMLAKLGWKEGEGLGAQGEGRTTAIETDVRTHRAGLGAKDDWSR
jgi:hypothetical protein